MQTVTELKRCDPHCDYAADKERLKKFILFYSEDGAFKYLDSLRTLDGGAMLAVDLDDIAAHDSTGLAMRTRKNAWSYMRLLSNAVDEILDGEAITGDPCVAQRVARFKERYPEKSLIDVFPGFLLHNYTVGLKSNRTVPVHSLRAVRAENVGSLITVRGIVTKVSAIKPSVRIATYICESCGSETYQQISEDAFDLLEECNSLKCRERNVRGTLTLFTRGSKFIKFQSVQLQELTNDVPNGGIPRSLRIELFGELTGRLCPGEVRAVTGVFMPRPYRGLRKLKAGLLNDTFLYCTFVNEECEKSEDGNPTVNPLDCVSCSLEVLVDNFAPEIFGMRDVKKILLLMLAGAPTLEMGDGMKIRGNLNALLLGDPGIAKSQLLKTTVKISERGVYTTGRGSSGVGLTAAVSKDMTTKEMILEGGALVLADGGVCAIDELDKMNDVDRIAIHEVMEQQKVSISKAGINTTLNARCAVLGAANPVRSRYDPKRSVEQNVGLPVSLVSRFDVVCILRDDPGADTDRAMAEHITGLHLDGLGESIDYGHLRAYLSRVRQVATRLGESDSCRDALTDAYLNTRRESPSATPRALLALVRLALAHARIHLRETVTASDVSAARALFETMKIPTARKEAPATPKQAIYALTLSLAVDKVVSLALLFERAPYPRSVVEDVISDFESSGIWMRNNEELVIFN